MSDELFIPQNPRAVPIRPLDKGIVRDISPTLVPLGAFWDLVNYLPEVDGVRRRGGLRTVVDGSSTIKEWDLPLVDLAPYWSSEGERSNLLLGQRGIYTWTPTGSISHIDWTHDHTGDGTFTFSSGEWTLTHTGEDFTADGVQVGDVVEANSVWTTVSAVGTTTLTLQDRGEFTSAITSGNDYSYEVYQGNNPASGWPMDWANINGKTVFAASSGRYLLAYTGSGFGLLKVSPTTAVSRVRAVAWMDNRLWIGGMTEDASRERQRIRWTTTTTHDDFPAANYVDLPYTDSEIMRMVPMGSLMVVYMGTAIFIGRPANFTDTPLYFEHFETGGVGLAGPKGVAEFLDGQFFVGQNDVYFLSASVAPQGVGNRQLREDIKRCSTPQSIYASPDPANNRVLFVIPGAQDGVDRVWSYHYKTQAWSYDEYACDFVAAIATGTSLTYNDLSTYATYAAWAADYPTIGAMEGTREARQLFVGRSEYIREIGRDQSVDFGTDPVTSVMETGDLDFDMPDTMKTLKRLTVKVHREGSGVLLSGESLSWEVYISTDGGYTWKRTGRDLTISEGENEGKVDVRVTGSTHRIRLRSVSQIGSYTVYELNAFVVRRGREVRY